MTVENAKGLTHVAGTFLIRADGAFLNGAGIDPRREDKNTTLPKSYRDGIGNRVPYVSAQAWRRWLRNTLIEETGWPASELRAIDLSEKGTTNKIAGELNPIDFAEDDIFGYMRAAKGQGRESASGPDEDKTEEELERERRVKFFKGLRADIASVHRGKTGKGKKEKDLSDGDRIKLARKVVQGLQEEVKRRTDQDEEELEEDIEKKLEEMAAMLDDQHQAKSALQTFRDKLSDIVEAFNPGRLKALMRASPFASSLLISVRRKGWEGLDKGFVHLKEGTPLPYNTEFYNTSLQGVFCLAYKRLGVFWNLGDRIELDEEMAERLLAGGKIRIVEDRGKAGKIYEMKDAAKERQTRGAELLKALAILRGGAKQAQFGTDVSPKVLILAGLSCGNPIFNHLFVDGSDDPRFKTETFKEIIQDYAGRIVTPVFVGIRKGCLGNEDEVRELHGWWQIKPDAKFEKVGERPKHGVSVEVRITTCLEAGRCMGEFLP